MARQHYALITYDDGHGMIRHATLQQDVTTLGRSDTCTIVIDQPTISRLHARIELQYDRYLLFDAESANGTFVNGQHISRGHPLGSGDIIWLGTDSALLTFVDPEETLQAAPGAPVVIDERAHQVYVYGQPVSLSPLEYGLLLHLARHPGTVCTREACFQAVWGQVYDQQTCEDAIKTCLAKLRRHLETTAQLLGREAPVITTVPRVGFRLDTAVVCTPEHARAREAAADPPGG